MTNILFDIWNEMGFPYHRQGSLTDETYPPSFFTYWNIDSDNASFYDNAERRYIEDWYVGFYTNDPNILYSTMDDFINRAKARGIVLSRRAKDVDADKDYYYGRGCTVKIIHNVEE